MKKIILGITVLLVICACKKEATIKDSTSENPLENTKLTVKPMVDALLTNWHLAASNADFDAYFGALSDESIFIGTQADEVWDKQAFQDFSQPYFDKGEAWDFRTKYRNIYFDEENKNFVWFDELLDTWMGECRGSGIIKFNPEKDKYEIKHYTLSLTVPNDKMNDVIRAIGMVEPRE